MKSKITVREMTGIAILTAILAGLWAFSTFIPTPALKLNFALVPIVVGACIYGPWCGLFLGVVDGILVVLDPATAGFLAVNVFLTILLCVLKTGLAGLVSGFLFKLLKKKQDLVACFAASLVVPVINTGLFLGGTILFFLSVFGGDVMTLLGVVFTLNFAIEFAIAVIMSPAIYKIIRIVTKNKTTSVSGN
ncbi:MAG: ECF transporter S component [Bacilli bacterium]|nr:ECF transporter S component [Bacilli bacterium]